MFCREFPFVLDFSGSFVNGIVSYEYFWAFWKVFRCWTHYLILLWTGATCMWNKGSREGFCCPLCHWWPGFFREQKQTSCNEQMCNPSPPVCYLCQTTSSQFINRAESQTWSWDVTSAFAAHARQTSQNILRGFIVAEDQKLLFEMFMTAGWQSRRPENKFEVEQCQSCQTNRVHTRGHRCPSHPRVTAYGNVTSSLCYWAACKLSVPVGKLEHSWV